MNRTEKPHRKAAQESGGAGAGARWPRPDRALRGARGDPAAAAPSAQWEEAAITARSPAKPSRSPGLFSLSNKNKCRFLCSKQLQHLSQIPAHLSPAVAEGIAQQSLDTRDP
ncbi:uncharacterized protein LOC143696631 [Agelaius phoeniceus]|uniref:uncharacterized protein LOC143696631 n=1 Tax=Agelaius phoeniceus TaxID=39638 RepID=UPI004054AEAA